MRTMLLIPAVSALLIVLAPAVSALPLVDVVGPHPDGTGANGATCMDVIAASSHVGTCEGAASCPLYYDFYNGQKGCEYTPPVYIGFLPFFEVVGPHNDGNPTGAQCSDVLAGSSHLGTCVGDPNCPVYYDDYAGFTGCL